MNSTPPPLPGLVSLYRHDLVIQRTANVAGFGVLVAAGMYWVSQPVPSPLPPIDNSFDVAMMKLASLGGIVMSGMAMLILLWRWMRVRKILKEGTVIKGLVEDIDVVVTKWTSSDSHSLNNQTRRSNPRALLEVVISNDTSILEKTLALAIPSFKARTRRRRLGSKPLKHQQVKESNECQETTNGNTHGQPALHSPSPLIRWTLPVSTHILANVATVLKPT